MPHRREARLREFAELLSARISEAKDAGASRERNKAAFRDFADTLPCIVWTATPDGQVTWFNQRWHDLMGCDGREWTELLHPEDMQATVGAWSHSVASNTPFCHTARVRDAGGSFHSLVSRAHPIRDEAGHVLYWIGSSNVLTQAAMQQRQVA